MSPVATVDYAGAGGVQVQFIGTSTEEERSAFFQDGPCTEGALVEPSMDDPNTLRVFMPDAIPAVFAERLRHHETAQRGYSAMWAELDATLTAIGGHGVWVEEYINEALPHLLAACELVPEGVVIVQGPGRPNECHASVMAMCESGQLLHMFRGYALDKSGFWVSHSWGQTHNTNSSRPAR